MRLEWRFPLVLAAVRLAVACSTAQGPRPEVPPDLGLAIFLPEGAFIPGTLVNIEFELVNRSRDEYLVDMLPAFHDQTGKGDFILRVLDVQGRQAPRGCIQHAGRRTFYAPLSPGQRRRFRNDLSCFDFSVLSPGRYRLEARYVPRNEGCTARPGARCYVGPAPAASVGLRWDGSRLSADTR